MPIALPPRRSAPTSSGPRAFAPSRGGAQHVHIHVGDEGSPTFTESARYTTLVGAGLPLGDRFRDVGVKFAEVTAGVTRRANSLSMGISGE